MMLTLSFGFANAFVFSKFIKCLILSQGGSLDNSILITRHVDYHSCFCKNYKRPDIFQNMLYDLLFLIWFILSFELEVEVLLKVLFSVLFIMLLLTIKSSYPHHGQWLCNLCCELHVFPSNLIYTVIPNCYNI